MRPLAGIRAPASARILGLGHNRPDNIVTNHDLIARGVNTDDEWIRSRVGIVERRWAAAGETVVDMAVAASANALANSEVGASDIGLVLVATCTMPTSVPAAAPQLASRLGIDSPGVFDVNSGCSGFMYALNTAAALVRSGHARTALVVGTERFSGWLDMSDRSTCIILGDGAGAAVVGASDVAAMGPVVWGSDGSQSAAVTIDEESRFFEQDGQAVFGGLSRKCHRSRLRPAVGRRSRRPSWEGSCRIRRTCESSILSPENWTRRMWPWPVTS